MRRGLAMQVDTPRGPADAAALAVAAELQGEMDALARAVGLSRAGDAGSEAWRLEGSVGYCPRSRALQAIASAHAAVARLREAASGARSNETLLFRRGRAEQEIRDARALVAALVEDGRVAA